MFPSFRPCFHHFSHGLKIEIPQPPQRPNTVPRASGARLGSPFRLRRGGDPFFRYATRPGTQPGELQGRRQRRFQTGEVLRESIWKSYTGNHGDYFNTIFWCFLKMFPKNPIRGRLKYQSGVAGICTVSGHPNFKHMNMKLLDDFSPYYEHVHVSSESLSNKWTNLQIDTEIRTYWYHTPETKPCCGGFPWTQACAMIIPRFSWWHHFFQVTSPPLLSHSCVGFKSHTCQVVIPSKYVISPRCLLHSMHVYVDKSFGEGTSLHFFVVTPHVEPCACTQTPRFHVTNITKEFCCTPRVKQSSIAFGNGLYHL